MRMPEAKLTLCAVLTLAALQVSACAGPRVELPVREAPSDADGSTDDQDPAACDARAACPDAGCDADACVCRDDSRCDDDDDECEDDACEDDEHRED